MLKRADVATAIFSEVRARQASWVHAVSTLEGLFEPNIHNARTIARAHHHLIDVVARDACNFRSSSKVWTHGVLDGDGLNVRVFVSASVRGHPCLADHEVACTVQRDGVAAEGHGTTGRIAVVASVVRGVEVRTVVRHLQARNVDVPSACLVMEIAPLDGVVGRSSRKCRCFSVVALPNLADVLRLSRSGINQSVGQRHRLASAICVREGWVAHVGDDVAREAHDRLSVQHTTPSEPTSESILAVVVVSAHSELESLVHRNRHVAEVNLTRDRSCTSQARNGVAHVVDFNA